MMHVSTITQKVDWLRTQEHLWRDLPDGLSPYRWTDEQKAVLTDMRYRAVNHGLFSFETYWRDVESSLLKCIKKIRLGIACP